MTKRGSESVEPNRVCFRGQTVLMSPSSMGTLSQVSRVYHIAIVSLRMKP